MGEHDKAGKLVPRHKIKAVLAFLAQEVAHRHRFSGPEQGAIEYGIGPVDGCVAMAVAAPALYRVPPRVGRVGPSAQAERDVLVSLRIAVPGNNAVPFAMAPAFGQGHVYARDAVAIGLAAPDDLLTAVIQAQLGAAHRRGGVERRDPGHAALPGQLEMDRHVRHQYRGPAEQGAAGFALRRGFHLQ
nr:hypothetical protein [Massilia glaciei]